MTTAATDSPFDEVRLWLVDLDESGADAAQAWLSASESARAERFVFAQDARRYRAAHIALRSLLLQHCAWPAGAEFGTGAHGKPRLASCGGRGFNLSHSEGWALIGIDTVDGLGVDIEVIRPLDDAFLLAEHNFSASEREALHRLPAGEVSSAFLGVWTRKEACLKALGTGLSIAPAGFHAGLAADAGVVTVQDGPQLHVVQVRSLALGPGIAAAVARRQFHCGDPPG